MKRILYFTLLAFGFSLGAMEQAPKKYETLHDAIQAQDLEALSTMLGQKKWDINELRQCTIATEKHTLTPLMLASYFGHFAIVQALINAGADVNKQNQSGTTALIYAAEKGRTSIAQTLINAGANVNKQDQNGGTALIFAAYNGNTAIVQVLINAGADVNKQNQNGDTALIYAAEKGRTSIVQALINAGADINKQAQNGGTALMLAAYNGNTAIAQALIKAGADINKQDQFGRTVLIFAAYNGKYQVIKTFIKAKNIIEHELFYNRKDNSQKNALTWCAIKNKPNCFKYLLAEQGIEKANSLAATDILPKFEQLRQHYLNGIYGALFTAIQHRNLPLCKTLVKRVKDIRIYDDQWENPLHKAFAAAFEDNLAPEQLADSYAIIGLLLVFNSDLLIEENKTGFRPIDYAINEPTGDLFLLLKKLVTFDKKINKPTITSPNNEFAIAMDKK